MNAVNKSMPVQREVMTTQSNKPGAGANLWGIDMGGTKIEGVIMKSANDTEVLFRDRVPTHADRGYDAMLNQVNALVDKMAGAVGYRPEYIGIGTPGVLVPKYGVMKNCNTTALNGMPLKKDLEQVLGARIALANDANCFALAEARLGVVRERFPNARVVFGMIIGTGVGGGVVVDGHVLNGFHGLGGEWGHNYLCGPAGKPCYCGKTGCIESILSGPALEDYYHAITGIPRKLAEIAMLADKMNDRASQKTVKRLTDNFGLAVSTIVNILDPDVIVVGGGVGNIDRLYTEGVAAIAHHVFNDGVFEAPVVKPSLGDSAGVFGAAYLVA